MQSPRAKVRNSSREASAELAGRQWVESVCEQLQQDERRPTGGWPGTISEARARVMNIGELSPDEREHLARLLYQSARTFWAQRRVNEE